MKCLPDIFRNDDKLSEERGFVCYFPFRAIAVRFTATYTISKVFQYENNRKSARRLSVRQNGIRNVGAKCGG